MDDKKMSSLRNKVKIIYPNASDEQIDDFIQVRLEFWSIFVD